MIKNQTLIGPWARRFLLEHIVGERNLAHHTQAAYRDALALLLPFAGRVEEGRGVPRSMGPVSASPLIEPDVRISRIRLSDRFHVKAFEAGVTFHPPKCRRPKRPKTSSAGNRRVPLPAIL